MNTHPEELLARAADAAPMSEAERQELEAHLEGCAACREALEAQRVVSRVLHQRAESVPSPAFAARVSARLDEHESSGLLDVVNWRAWTAGLAPLAAALLLAAWLGVGATSQQSASQDVATTVEPTLETWVAAGTDSTPARVFLQPSTTGDQLLETVLTGTAPASSGGTSDVR